MDPIAVYLVIQFSSGDKKKNDTVKCTLFCNIEKAGSGSGDEVI